MLYTHKMEPTIKQTSFPACLEIDCRQIRPTSDS